MTSPASPAASLAPLRVAIATCRAFPDLYQDDQPLIPALAARGIEAVPVVWNDGGVAWDRFDAVVVRSTWDYFQSSTYFLSWLQRVSETAPLVNAHAMLRWNVHKGYLRDLEARGIRVVPTAWCEKNERVRVDEILRERGWTDVVIKPAISAGANRTLRVVSNDEARLGEGRALLKSLLVEGDALVQPYVGSVERRGERSLVYFDGVFSHAIRKHALLAPGAVDPSQQAEGVPVVEPTDAEKLFALRTLEATRASTGSRPVYARVDSAQGEDGQPTLMEIEVLEPCLFLRVGLAHDCFADALARSVRAARGA